MKTTILRLTAIILLGVFSLSSCDDDTETAEQTNLTINLNKENAIVEIGSTISLVAGFSPSDAPNKAHTWTSENPQIATVDETGKVKGISIGTTRITATALANNATATCTVEVVDKIIAVTSVTLNSKEDTISVGSTTSLTATILPTTATDQNVVWTSSNNAVATVNENGLVKGLSVGSANITASVGGKSGVCAVTVTEKSVDFSNIKFTVQADGSLLVSGTVTPIGVNVSEVGVCFSTETTPTIEHNKYVLTTTGLNVNKEINDLPQNSYYTRMYAKEGNTIYYGKSTIVKVPEKFSAQFKLVKSRRTCYFQNVSSTYDYFKSDISVDLSTPDIEGYNGINICYGIAPNPEITDNLDKLYQSNGKLEASIRNLSQAKKYYVRAYGLKNGKPIYYPEEASFTTIGADTRLDIKYARKESIGYSYRYYYTISYSLPEEGIYEVSVSSHYYTSTRNNFLSTQYTGNYIDSVIYIKEGSGSIYLRSENTGYNGFFTILFRNIDTGTEIELRTDRYN